MRSRNAGASGPTTSILPSVDASIDADARCAPRAHSRCDRALHRLAVAREEPRALPLADVLERGAVLDVPRHGSASVRIGSNRAPRYGPASVANGTGTARRPRVRRSLRVRATRRGAAFTISAVMTPARAALIDRGADVRGALHVLDGAQPRVDRVGDVRDRSGRAGSRRSGARCPRLGTNQYGASFGDLAGRGPDDRQPGWPLASGRTRATSSSNRRPPPIARHSARFGSQPPDTRSESHSIVRRSPSGPSRWTASSRRSPSVPETTQPRSTSASLASPEVGFGPAHVRDRGHLAAVRDEVRRRAVGAPRAVNTTVREPTSTPCSRYSDAA